MQTRITARGFDVSDGLRTHIEGSVERLERYFDGIHDAHVILNGHGAPGEEKMAEITVQVPRGQLRAAGAAATHKDAVTGAVRQIRRQVLRYKDRVRSRRSVRHR